MSVFLSRAIEPLRYSITLTPDLERCVFAGTESVELMVHDAGQTSITFHAHQLAIKGAVLLPKAQPVTITHTLAAQTCTLAFADALPVGAATLHLTFEGVLNDDLCGFYRSKYTVGGATRYHAVTQFEPTDGAA